MRSKYKESENFFKELERLGEKDTTVRAVKVYTNTFMTVKLKKIDMNVLYGLVDQFDDEVLSIDIIDDDTFFIHLIKKFPTVYPYKREVVFELGSWVENLYVDLVGYNTAGIDYQKVAITRLLGDLAKGNKEKIAL